MLMNVDVREEGLSTHEQLATAALRCSPALAGSSGARSGSV